MAPTGRTCRPARATRRSASCSTAISASTPIRPTRTTRAKGTTQYTYDAAGRLTFINYPNSPDVTLNYDAANRLTVVFDHGQVRDQGPDTDPYLLGARAADTASHPAVRAELDRLVDLGYLTR